ncbi:MAG: hypothetical protein ABR981_00870 [Candidatus Micrarchaeaceae archaeon]|jgi:hypothetical protein
MGKNIPKKTVPKKKVLPLLRKGASKLYALLRDEKVRDRVEVEFPVCM